MKKPDGPKLNLVPNTGGKLNDDASAIRAQFAKMRKEGLAGVQFLSETATAEERECYDLCQDICRIFNERKMSIQALAQGLGMSIDRANLVIHSQYRALNSKELGRALEKLLLTF